MSKRWWAGLVSVVVAATACQTSTSAPTATAPDPAPPVRHIGSTTAVTERPALTLQIDEPAEVGAGQVLLAQLAARHRTPVTVSPPDGWTQVGQTRTPASRGAANAAGDAVTSWVFLRVADGSEPDSYTFTATSPTAMVGSLGGFADVDAADPIDAFAGVGNASSASLDGPALTTHHGNTVAVWLGTQLSGPGGCRQPTIKAPAGFRSGTSGCTSTGAGLAFTSGMRQLGASSVQPRWSGASSVAAGSVVQVVALRPVDGQFGDGRLPWAQVSDRFSPKPAPSLEKAGGSGYLLWDGRGPGERKDVDIAADVLYQPSGLAASRTNPHVVYANSEKDRGTMVALDALSGEVLGAYTVRIPDLFDWEDMAAGPCPTGSCLYAADIGTARDVPKPNRVFSVTRFPEPDVAGGQTSGTLAGETVSFTYPDGARPDAEALLVHPWTGDIYVITKSQLGTSEVYRLPTPLPEPGVVAELVEVGSLRLPVTDGTPESAAVTGAAVHPVANRFLVRTYRHVYEFRGPAGGSFADALTGERVELTDPGESQGEAITYAVDGSAYYTLSEADKPPYRLNRVDRG